MKLDAIVTVVQNYLGGGIVQEDYSMKLDVIITVVQNYLRGQWYKVRRNYNGSKELFRRTVV